MPDALRRAAGRGGRRRLGAGVCHLLAVTLLVGGLPRWATAAQELVACTLVDHDWAPGVTPVTDHRLAFAQGRVTRIVVRNFDGLDSTTRLAPFRPGLSHRTVLAQSPTDPQVWRSVFNLATVEADGTILLETWVRQSTHPGEERRSWTRVRCGPQV